MLGDKAYDSAELREELDEGRRALKVLTQRRRFGCRKASLRPLTRFAQGKI
jgi:hypothetical protein